MLNKENAKKKVQKKTQYVLQRLKGEEINFYRKIIQLLSQAH